MDETLNDFGIGNGITLNTLGNETLEPQANGQNEKFGRVVKGASQNQVIAINTDDRIRDSVDCADIAVKNCMLDATLIAMNDEVFQQVEMAVRSIKCSSGNGPECDLQNPHRRDFTRITKNTPLKSAASRLVLKIEQDEIDWTRDTDNSKDGDISATEIIYNRRVHAHYMMT